MKDSNIFSFVFRKDSGEAFSDGFIKISYHSEIQKGVCRFEVSIHPLQDAVLIMGDTPFQAWKNSILFTSRFLTNCVEDGYEFFPDTDSTTSNDLMYFD